MNNNTLIKQDEKYLNDNIVESFHALTLHGSHSKLIGSSSYRHFLYSNDYDLNENLHVTDTESVLHGIYLEFLDMFNKLYKNPDYYIIDFKCGEDNNHNALRWTYSDMKKGYKSIDGIKYNFIDCLLQDVTIKIDIIYVLNNVFTDITNNYFLHITKNKTDFNQSKQNKVDEIVSKLENEIEEQITKENYFKVLKRHFSKMKVQGSIEKDVLQFLNSDYARFSKCIHDINVIVILLEQKFKPISIQLIHDNIQVIKQFMSYITSFNVNHILDKLIEIDKLKNKTTLHDQLQILLTYCEKFLNDKIKNVVLNKIKDT